MIDRYTTKFGPAMSQKGLEKALHESGEMPIQPPPLHKMKARIKVHRRGREASEEGFTGAFAAELGRCIRST